MRSVGSVGSMGRGSSFLLTLSLLPVYSVASLLGKSETGFEEFHVEEETIPVQFKRLEDRIGQLVGKCQDLQRAKAELEATIGGLEKAVKMKDAAEQQQVEEKKMIRSRIDALLSRLDQVVGSG